MQPTEQLTQRPQPEKTVTCRDRLVSEEWRRWRDPEVPQYFNPTTHLLDRHLEGAAHKCALIADGVRYSYQELLDKVCQAAHSLISLGLKADNRILLFGNDSIQFVATWLGAVRCGAVPVGISDLYKAPNLLYFLQDAAARALFIDAEQLAKLAEIKENLPATLEQIIVCAKQDGFSLGRKTGAKMAAYDDVAALQPEQFEPLPRHENDVTYMFYSGGTTGTAKGITHLAHDFALIPERHGAFWEYGSSDIVFATSKKYFTHGLWPGLLIPLYWGAASVISREVPSAEQVMAIVEHHRPTKLITVPTVIRNILLAAEQTGRAPDFSSLRLVISASEKMPPEIFDKFHALFGIELLDSIGSSEITYEWIANRPKEFKRGSLGKPVFGNEIKLVDEQNSEVTEPYQTGEAWVNSRTACLFYWRKFDLTKETFVGPWARTGDILYFDEDGFFWYSGRCDDVFKVKGLWVSPIEVEAAITENPAVLEAAVIPYEDASGFFKPKAFVVLRPGLEPSEALTEALREGVRKIGAYKVPQGIEYVQGLPRTSLLKIDRRALREKEKAERRARQ